MTSRPLRPLAIALLAIPALASASGFSDVLTEGKPSLDLRYRYEHVHQDNALRDAQAHTLRTRLGWRSGEWRGFSGLVEFDTVTRLGGATYHDTRNGRGDYATIADPEGGEFNQALLRHDGGYGSVAVGRQRIVLGNQRFVGGVAWRQNEQTYDGVQLQLAPADGLRFTYAFVDRVNTIFGPEDRRTATAANRSDIDGDSHLFDLRYEASPALSLAAYHYRLDLDNAAVSPGAPLGTLSSRTTGARLGGAWRSLSYAAEYARQTEGAGNPWTLDSDYRLLELGYAVRQAKFTAGYEALGGGTGAGNRAFQTPLATKHAFQGWADVFLTTPADGVVDRYLGASAPLAGGTVQAWYHDFVPERGGGDYGHELDLSYARAIPGVQGLTGLLKYARYASDDRTRSVDTEKFWLQLQYAY
ncbi:alginate export family protein [Luteimonas huabeiensis]|uniref:alginate export family protein n=1 Tax=Luteimonas huabeiensis TaxID=1244513 RepID=UPI0004643D41|nr:alginate export family protein [Luteimonas huabeiensis]